MKLLNDQYFLFSFSFGFFDYRYNYIPVATYN